MSGIRAFLRDRKGVIVLLLALTLALRALLPTGYMANSSPNGLTIELCSGVAGKTVTLALPGAPKQDHGDKSGAAMPCAFSALGFDGAAAVDPVLLTLAIAFVLATGWRFLSRFAASRREPLRPPSHGPPSIG